MRKTLLVVSMVMVSSAARAEDAKCNVKLSGALEGSVPCKVTFMAMGAVFHLGVGAGAQRKPVTAHLLVDFNEAPTARAYAFDSVSNASSSASAESKKGTVWEMMKGGPSKIPDAPPVKQKGEFTLTLTAAGKRPGDFHGHATMTLLPNTMGGGPQAEPVKVELDF